MKKDSRLYARLDILMGSCRIRNAFIKYYENEGEEKAYQFLINRKFTAEKIQEIKNIFRN